jgi:hypothetical protein
MSANESISEKDKEDYNPKDGSWVAELEDAQADLDDLLKSGDPAVVQRRRGVALQLYLRLCRAFHMLRQWKNVEEAAEKGLEVCASYVAAPRGGAANTLLWNWEVQFVSCRSVARREAASVQSSLDAPAWSNLHARMMAGEVNPDHVYRPHATFPNSNLLQHAALVGDVHLMEATAAAGAAIDHPFLWGDGASGNLKFPIVAPADATALVMACAILALEKRGRTHPWLSPQEQEALDWLAECAMQLVHLGADPTKSLSWSNAPDTDTSRKYRAFRLDGNRLDGQSALELAVLAGQWELVDLMERHLRCSPEERAHMVHCRCGSRLPWEQCHSTGIGMPSHYVADEEAASQGGGAVVHYRVSPLARCPCGNTSLTHYECCWKDTACPAYLNDSGGQQLRETAGRPEAAIGDVPFASRRHPRRQNVVFEGVARPCARPVRRGWSSVPNGIVGAGRLLGLSRKAQQGLRVEGLALAARQVGAAAPDPRVERSPRGVLRRRGPSGRRARPGGCAAHAQRVRPVWTSRLRRVRIKA